MLLTWVLGDFAMLPDEHSYLQEMCPGHVRSIFLDAQSRPQVVSEALLGEEIGASNPRRSFDDSARLLACRRCMCQESRTGRPPLVDTHSHQVANKQGLS